MSTRTIKPALWALMFCLLSAPAYANVSLRNGNFFIGYTDIVYSGGFEPKIERVYNSKTPFKGMFGYGWGSELEVYLTVSPDGAVIVHEYGGGAENVFSPPELSKQEFEAAIATIIQAAQESKNLRATPQDVAPYEKKLRADATFRNDEWEKHLKLGLIKARDLPVGALLYSNRFSAQALRRTRDGFIRVFDNGRREQFDSKGHLARVFDKNNNFIEFSYDNDGLVTLLTDNYGRKMRFTFNDRGLVAKIEGDNKRTAEYRYDDNDNLVYSKDVDSNAYEHQYDSHHNMTKILYSDNTTLEIAYHSVELLENVASVKDRDGTLTTYRYLFSANDSGHLTIEVVVKGSDAQVLSKNTYEYFTKRDEAGIEWTYKMITDYDGDRTETIYQRAGNLPISIQRGAAATKFQYDDQGHVTRKEEAGLVTELTYDERVNKVSAVKKYRKETPTQVTWAKFTYDPKGNLIYAENSENKKVKLIYDDNGRIRELVRQDNSRLQFDYNVNSKPIEIRLVAASGAVSKINVKYTASGEIEKVDSDSGRAVALQVTAAFQELLEIIRPAGVSLSF